MAKLSKLILRAIICASVNAQDEPIFQVTSCNVDVSIRLIYFGSKLPFSREIMFENPRKRSNQAGTKQIIEYRADISVPLISQYY